MYLYIQMEVSTVRLVLSRSHSFQLCSAHTLRDWLQANTSKEVRARDAMLRWFAQITSAVNYVHVEHKLVHRDLKVAQKQAEQALIALVTAFQHLFLTQRHYQSRRLWLGSDMRCR